MPSLSLHAHTLWGSIDEPSIPRCASWFQALTGLPAVQICLSVCINLTSINIFRMEESKIKNENGEITMCWSKSGMRTNTVKSGSCFSPWWWIWDGRSPFRPEVFRAILLFFQGQTWKTLVQQGEKLSTENSVYGNCCAIHDCQGFSCSTVHAHIHIPAEKYHLQLMP